MYHSQPYLLFIFLSEMIPHPTILDAVEAIPGPDILCRHGNFFTKEANTVEFSH
ncbi:MAG: hypothetical protein IIA40_04630 [SAR324 cluster bacterium]|nr:hypothetical protein [SAR324 cluster bacterium]